MPAEIEIEEEELFEDMFEEVDKKKLKVAG